MRLSAFTLSFSHLKKQSLSILSEFLRINQVQMSLIKLANPCGLANLSISEADAPGLCGKILFLCFLLSSNKQLPHKNSKASHAFLLFLLYLATPYLTSGSVPDFRWFQLPTWPLFSVTKQTLWLLENMVMTFRPPSDKPPFKMIDVYTLFKLQSPSFGFLISGLP